ncbi:hypothetical protein N5I80_07705 [Acinetobacter junii]|uniref:Uncharacterized protein n=1 Tax=Acinetobacter parvus NIPH 1103 TaxID=1217671 RepID=N8Q5G7_9GAMM|nr:MULTISPECIES: hypothetical protein [Acinetobacter]ENU33775.1 hypothetical protein F989_01261 [Acinetobacter parvus NIPH 1103]ENU86544.1 hypothetical protein F973_01199 [Acinetobacter sp. CIP 102129]MDH1376434.1 hypothetical protein [Acinetobacter junii]
MILSEYDLKDCQNDRIKTSMKQSFDESSYAQTYHLKAVIIETKQKKARQGYLLRCNANITLNNSETLSFTFNFSKKNDQYLIEGTPNY